MKSVSRVFPCRRTDGHDEAYSSFPQFYEHTRKPVLHFFTINVYRNPHNI